MLNMRPKDGGPAYSPQRDWAYCLPAILKKVNSLFDKAFWPEIVRFVAVSRSIPEEEAWNELCDAAMACAKFATLCAGEKDSAEKSVQNCFEESGWMDISHPAQIGYLAMLGQVFMGQMYHGLRDITPLGGGPSDLVKELQRLTSCGDIGRRVLNNLTIGDDKKTYLAHLVRTMRNEDVSWEVIERIIAREKSLES